MPETISAGTRVGPYEVVGWLGAGGMGEVYRARDTRLGRDVALKVISGAVIDAGRMRRFEQEARAAARLAHPNILAVHDIGAHESVPYIVSELLEGESLGSRLRHGPLALRKALEVARQVADGLAAAHDKGIVHRDIKPDNVFITSDGRIKILDFGIAKLNAAEDDPALTGLATETSAGAVVGTAGYMSPEQIRSETVDARSDIFSLGAVLYEMVTGRAPFARATAVDTIAAILNADPPEAQERMPAGVARVIGRCLEKTREARYQSARDLAFGLEMLTGTNASAGPQLPRLRWRALVLPALTVASLATAAVVWTMREASAPLVDPLAGATFTRFTDWSGNEGSAEISPDGKFVVFIADRAGQLDAWVSQIGSGAFNNLTAETPPLPAPSMVMRLTGFSADGSHVWTTVDDAERRRRQYLTPLAGGTPRLLLGERDRAPAWSPDGSRLAFFTGSEGDPISVGGPLGGDPKQIMKDASGLHNHNPVWSPDGTWIYFVHGGDPLLGMDVWRVRPDGSGREQLTHLETDANFVAPLDDRTALFVARAPDMSGPWLWGVDVVTKTTRRLSMGLERFTSAAASRDGQRIVATVAHPQGALWMVPVLSDRPVTDADVLPYPVNASNPFGPRTAGSSLYFVNERGGANGLWRVDGSAEPVQVWSGFDGGLIEPPAVSRDGSRIAIVLREGRRRRLVSIAPDGTNPRTLGGTIDIHGTPRQSAADWSPDGQWIVAGGDDGTGRGLFKIPADGGAPVRLVKSPAQNPIWSPDGSVILYASEVVEGRAIVHAVHPDGSAAAFPAFQPGPGAYRFTADGRSVIFLPTIGGDNFRIIDVRSGRESPLSRMSNRGGVTTFDISSDGKSVIFERANPNADIMLIERPRPGAAGRGSR